MKKGIKIFDVIIIGAGASGLMCGISAGKRGRKVLILDHSDRPGSKLLISGGGKCNFTNYVIEADNYLCSNPHFVKSALSRFTQWDFLAMMQTHGIPVEEREQGQLFCKQSSKDLLTMLLQKCTQSGVILQLSTEIHYIDKSEQFNIHTDNGTFFSNSLVIATGGISWKSAGATDLGYKIAEQFGLKLISPEAGLVPLNLSKKDRRKWSHLSGISLTGKVKYQNQVFFDEILFTHQGLSGPAILQISNYWKRNNPIIIDFLPFIELKEKLTSTSSKMLLKNFMKAFLPERLIKVIIAEDMENKSVRQYYDKEIIKIHDQFHNFEIIPARKASMEKAEVTLGGVDTEEISPKTFESKKVRGLYFIGEVLDVAGWLGGYNLQWAWSSGWCAGYWV